MKLVEQPTGRRLGDWLNGNLGGDWAKFRAAVAFVKRSGVKHIAARLAAFAESRQVELIAGVDHQGTSREGLKGLMDAVSPNGRVVVFHNQLPHTFHPKVYLFKSDDRAEMVVGSGNLTEGGLYTNYEAGVQVGLDLSLEADREVLEDIEGALDGWANTQSGTSIELNDARLESLVQAGLVLKEADMPGVAVGKGGSSSAGYADSGDEAAAFQAVSVPAAPSATPLAHTPPAVHSSGAQVCDDASEDRCGRGSDDGGDVEAVTGGLRSAEGPGCGTGVLGVAGRFRGGPGHDDVAGQRRLSFAVRGAAQFGKHRRYSGDGEGWRHQLRI